MNHPSLSDVPILCKDCGFSCGHAAAFEYFERVNGAFADYCMACQNKRQVAEVIKTRRKLMKQIDAVALAALANAKPGGTNAPHLATLLSEITRLFGGSEGFAAHFVGTYLNAKPGSPVRQRLLGQYLNLAAGTTATGKAALPVETMTDEELAEALEERRAAVARAAGVEAHEQKEGEDGEPEASDSAV